MIYKGDRVWREYNAHDFESSGSRADSRQSLKVSLFGGRTHNAREHYKMAGQTYYDYPFY